MVNISLLKFGVCHVEILTGNYESDFESDMSQSYQSSELSDDDSEQADVSILC